MTDEQKAKIEQLRKGGFGYVRIARMLGISENTVRSFCRRNNLTGSGQRREEAVSPAGEHICPCCGNPVPQNPGRKVKKFCSDECRMKWWNSHPGEVNRKAVYDFTCRYCGKSFTAYGNSKRKYCCHECYVKDRFGR